METPASGIRTDKPLLLSAVLIVALAAGVHIVFVATRYRYLVDDAYIFIRYVDNFAYGRGLVYNPAELVIGYTSPLYVFLIALLKRLFISVDTLLLIRLANGVLVVAYAILCVKIFLRKNIASYAIPIVLLFHSSYIDGTLNGMETTAMLTSILMVIYALQVERGSLAFSFAAVAALVRPEGFLLLFTVAVYWLIVARKRIPVAGLAVAGIMLAAWIIATYSFFGAVLSQSMMAKSSWRSGILCGGAATAGIGGYILDVLGKHTMLSLAVNDRYMVGRLGAALTAASVVACVPFGLGLAQALRNRSAIAAPGIFYLLCVAFYVVGKPVHIWSWYTIPTSVCFVIVVLDWLNPIVSARGRILQYSYVALIAVVCALSAMLFLPRRYASISAMEKKLEYLSDFAKANLPPNATIMNGDIGMLGYRTKMRIIDLAGLVSPSVLPGKDRKARYLGDIVRRERPDLICLKSDIRTSPIVDERVLRYPAFRTEADKTAFFHDYIEIPNKTGMFYQHIFLRSDRYHKGKIIFPSARGY